MTPGRLSPRNEFTQVPSHSSTFVYMTTTTKCHAGASHPGASSPWFLYRDENFTPVRNLATVSCQRETFTRFGVKSVCWWTILVPEPVVAWSRRHTEGRGRHQTGVRSPSITTHVSDVYPLGCHPTQFQ